MADASKISYQKPFLKWVGGKTQIINAVMSRFPRVIENYHEPFLGGGSVLLALLSAVRAGAIEVKKTVYAYDVNEGLINLYKCIQSKKDELFEFITQYMEEYDSIVGVEVNRKAVTKEEAVGSKESYYYWMRRRFNEMDKNSVEYAALFLVINKLCFRGVYREGPNGFNVPYGHYMRTPTVITRDTLDEVSDLIRDVEFSCCDFSASISSVLSGDFVYLDPPYAPENDKSFVKYVVGGFTLRMHKKLFDMIKLAVEADSVSFVMSNAKVPLVTDAFAGYDIYDVVARRAINSKNPAAKTTEVLVCSG